LITRDINHFIMDRHKPYQPYGLLQLYMPYSTHKQVYAHTQRLGLQSARSAQRGKHNHITSLSLIHYTRRNAHTRQGTRV